MAFVDPGTGRGIRDSGRGPQPELVELVEDETCELGDVLGYDSGWKRAIATTGGVIQGRFIALAHGETKYLPAGMGGVKQAGQVPVSADPVVSYKPAEGEELTPGGYVYVAEGSNNGQITQTAPSTTGDANTIIGMALSATKVMFFLNSRADSTAS